MKAGIDNSAGLASLKEIETFKEALSPELAYKIVSDALEVEIDRLRRIPNDRGILGNLSVVMPW